MKKNKGLYIIIGVLAVLVLILLALTVYLFVGNTEEKKGNSGNAGPFVVKEEDDKEEAPFKEEIEQEPQTEKGIYFVSNGCKVLVPADYECLYKEDIGLIIYRDDVFQMKLAVKDGSYEEAAKNPDSLTEKTVAAGGEILEPVKETEVDGRKYLYFLMELTGDKCLVIYSQAPDSNKRIAGHIVIQSDTMTNEDLIHMFAGIAGSAVETDEPDTTLEDILNQEKAEKTGEVKTESTLSIEKDTITYKVPTGYYSISTYGTGDYICETFATEGNGVEVECALNLKDGMGIGDAKAYVECWFDWLPDNVQKEEEIQSLERDGRTYYYYDVHYKFDEKDVRKILAACDIDDKTYYTVEVVSFEEDAELTMDSIQEFLSVK